MDRGTQRPRSARLPRTRCVLCEQEIIWVEHGTRKVPLNPRPVTDHRYGEFKRVGATNKVTQVPETERWTHSTLYEGHRDTCLPWLQCKAEGIRTFDECKKRSKPAMTQLVRENQEPEKYGLRRDM